MKKLIKKAYQAPQLVIVPLRRRKPLLTGSVENMRTVSGSWAEEEEE